MRRVELHRAVPPALFGVSVLVFLYIHIPALFISPSFDDWPVIAVWRNSARTYHGLDAVINAFLGTTGNFWRPLPNFFFALIRGESAVLPQSLKLAMLIFLGLLLVRIGKELNISYTAAWVSGAAMLLHQGMVLGHEIDRWGDILLMVAFMGIVYSKLRYDAERITFRTHLLSITLLTLVGVLAKEAGVIAFLLPLVVDTINSRSRILSCRAVIASLCSLAVIIAYFLFRELYLHVEVVSTDPYYQLKTGSNVVSNLVLMLVGLLSPLNTVEVVMSGAAFLTLTVILTGLISLGLAVKAWKARAHLPWRTLLMLIVLSVVVQGPTMFLARNTETNIARSLPFELLALSMILSASWSSIQPSLRYIGLTSIAVIMSLHVLASEAKIDGLVRVSDQARHFRDSVQLLMPIPLQRKITYVAERTYHGYSSYARPLWMCLEGDAIDGMRERYHDPNYDARVIVHDGKMARSNLPDSVDFLLDGQNQLYDRYHRVVSIQPTDPYLK